MPLLFACAHPGAAPGPLYLDGAPSQDADVGCHLLVDRFADGDQWNNERYDKADPRAWHGGDLAGIVQHLDDLRSIGCGAAWLTPIAVSAGGYRVDQVADLERIESRFGGQGAALALAGALHRQRLQLWLDWDPTAAVPGTPGLDPAWFHPLLDLSLPAARQAALSPVLQQAQVLDLAGLRITGEILSHPDQLSAVTAELHARTELRLVADLRGDTPAGLASARQRAGVDAVFDHPLRRAVTDVFCARAPVGELAAVLARDGAYGQRPGAVDDALITSLDTLDGPRFPSTCRALGGAQDDVQQALAFTLSARGTPLLSYGTEFGLGASVDQPWGEPMPYGLSIRELSDGRRAHPSMTRGATWLFELDGPDLFAYARVLPDEATVVIVNRRAEQATVRLPPALAAGASMDTFHEVVGPVGPYLRHQLVANASGEQLRPFFLFADSVTVAYVHPSGPAGFAPVLAGLQGRPRRRLQITVPRDAAPSSLDVHRGDVLVLDTGDGQPVLMEPARDGGWRSPRIEATEGQVLRWRLGLRQPGGATTWEDGPLRFSLVGEHPITARPR